MTLFLQLLLNGLVSGSAIALLALGFVLIMRATGVFHLAHSATFVCAAYCLYLLVAGLGWPLWLAIAATFAVSALIGWLMDVAVYRPLRARRVPTVGMFIASLAVFIVVQNLLLLVFGGQFRALGLGHASAWTVAGVTITPVSVASLLSAPVLYGLLSALLRFTMLGRWIRAVSVSSTRAATIGINLNLTYGAVFALGSALVVPAAALAALELGIHPTLGFHTLLLAITAAIIGGLRNLNGALLGGLIIGVAQSMTVLWLSATWQQSIVFGFLVFVLLFRPNGILPERA